MTLPGGPYLGRDTTQALHVVPYASPATPVQYDDQPAGMTPGHYLSLVSAIGVQLDRRFGHRTTGPVETRDPLGLGEDESKADVADMFNLYQAEQHATDHGYWL